MDFLKNFTIITLVLESLFNKVVGLKACNFTKKSIQHKCFPVNIANFLRTTFIIEHLLLILKSFNENFLFVGMDPTLYFDLLT